MVESLRPRPRAELLVSPSTMGDRGEPLRSESFLEASRRRLLIAALITAAVHVLYAALYFTVWIDSMEPVSAVVNLYSLVACLVCAGILASKPVRMRRLVGVGIFYHASLAVMMGVSEAVTLPDLGGEPISMISWNCANVLLVPLLVPLPPKKLLLVTLALAATTPLALVVMPPLLGEPAHAAATVVSMAIPPFVCALLAILPATVLESLHREVAKARRLGAYDLTDRIGEGGMGEVWEAKHRLLARPAAIKLVRSEVLASGGEAAERALTRFEREAKVTAALESPHTVELYDFGVADDGTIYYVMELLCGLDLQTLVARFGPLDPARAVFLLQQICDSLEEAHRAGLVHRDIKPANVFVSRKADHYDWVKVLDFGLVKPQELDMADGGDARVTVDGAIQGTPAFLSPEAATGDAPVSVRSDLYALGCVAYFALTGQLLFEAASPMKMAIAHVTETPVPPSERAEAAIPRELEELVMACLRKEPSDRPGSARAVAEQLARVPLSEPWTEERAADFWRDCLPEHYHA